jgi:CBS domain-containing protein
VVDEFPDPKDDEDSLEDGVAMLAAGDDEGVPVIDAGGRLVGWLTHRRVLRAYRRQAGLASNRSCDAEALDLEALAM